MIRKPREIDLLAGVLDEDHLPSLDFIADKGWNTRISPDFPLPQQIEWLCSDGGGAVRDKFAVFCFDGNTVVGPLNVPAKPEAVMRLLVEFAYASVLMRVDADLFFLKDSSDRYCIYFGSKGKVTDAYKLSPNDADQAFLEWVDEARFVEPERIALLKVFEHYKAARSA